MSSNPFKTGCKINADSVESAMEIAELTRHLTQIRFFVVVVFCKEWEHVASLSFKGPVHKNCKKDLIANLSHFSLVLY